jgi:hypothetical protein
MCDKRWQEANGSAFILFRPEEPNSGYKELEAAFLEAAQQQADVAGLLFPGPPTHTLVCTAFSLSSPPRSLSWSSLSAFASEGPAPSATRQR